LSLQAGGPPFIWSYFIAGFGQFFVCLIFSEVVSQFPIAGGVYSWTRRLVGKRWAWITGWVYGWALFTTIAAVSVGAGPFLSTFVGLPNTPFNVTVVALLMVLLATIINMMGTQTLARVAMFGFICELVGAIAVGGYLYIFGRHQSPAVFFQTFGITLNGSYLPAFAAAALAGLFTCYGFEACGDVAEETPNPGSAIPKSMRRTIYVGMGASIFVVVALVLSVTNLGAAPFR
jgi:amino acid transporter